MIRILLVGIFACTGPAVGLDTSAETAKQRIGLAVGLDRYLIGDDTPPVISTWPKDQFGDCPRAVKLFRPDGTSVDKLAAPGPYFAELTLTPKDGPPIVRRQTVYRLAEPATTAGPLADGTWAAWAKALAIPEQVLKRERQSLEAFVGNKPLAEFVHDARAAKLFAGLKLLSPQFAPSTKQNDAFAWERQGWLDVDRARLGLKPVDAMVLEPRHLEKPAAMVREGTPAEAGVNPAAVAELDKVLAEWAADDDQAFAVCVVRHGVIVLHKAYGTRDGKPMTLDTKSWMASITKPMAASCLMMLADRKLIDPDAPVEDYLPELKGLRKEPLKVRQLLNHTSGLAKWPADLYRDENSDVVSRLVLAYPHLEVGKEWGYNGQGYAVAGKIIERVSGLCMPRYYERCLLRPLGMKNTDVIGTHADARSVPLDIAKFGQMLLNGGRYGDREFFGPATFERMLPKLLTDDLGPDAKKVFGLGLDGKPNKFGHGAASAATFQIDRDRDLVVVMCRDKQGKNQGKYGGKFQAALDKCLK